MLHPAPPLRHQVQRTGHNMLMGVVSRPVAGPRYVALLLPGLVHRRERTDTPAEGLFMHGR